MAKRKVLTCLLVFCLGLFLAGCGGLGRPKEFSGENVMRFGSMVQRGQVYFGGDRWRIEAQLFGQKTITIIRTDKKIMWSLLPDQKTYTEVKLDPKQLVGRTNRFPGEVGRKKIAYEPVNGYPSDKYLVTFKTAGQDTKANIFQWISRDNIAVKTAATDNSWSSEYRDIKIGRQPRELFEIPSGYAKITTTQ
jgi:hypothetical protein